MSLWRGEPLVLASKSAARQALLAAARIPFKAEAADIDERAIEAKSGANRAGRRSPRIWRAPRRCMFRQSARALVLGADQTLALGVTRVSPSQPAPRRPPTSCARCRADPHAAFGDRGGARRRYRLRACRAAHLTMRPLERDIHRRLSRRGRRHGHDQRRRLSGRGRRHPACSKGSTAIIRPFSACRCCRCSISCAARAFWKAS